MKPHPAPSQEHIDRLSERTRQALDQLIPPDTQVPDNFFADKAKGLLYAIVARAADFFAYCPDDFCIGSINESGGVIVFGGTNRLIWNAKYGYHPDRSYCTSRFLEQFEGEVWEPIGKLSHIESKSVTLTGDAVYHEVKVPMDPRFDSIMILGRKSKRGDGKIAEVRFNTGFEA